MPKYYSTKTDLHKAKELYFKQPEYREKYLWSIVIHILKTQFSNYPYDNRMLYERILITLYFQMYPVSVFFYFLP